MKNNIAERNIYDTLVDLKDTLAQKSDSAKTQAIDTITELLDDLDSVKRASGAYAKQYVKSYPLKSLGVALLSGVLLGKFIL